MMTPPMEAIAASGWISTAPNRNTRGISVDEAYFYSIPAHAV